MSTETPAVPASPVRKRKRPDILASRQRREWSEGVELDVVGQEPPPCYVFDQPGQRQAPPVRTRTRPILKRLDPARGFSFLFAPRDARHDHIEANFTAKVRGTADELNTVLRRLRGRGDRGPFSLRERNRTSWHLDTRPGASLFEAQGTVEGSLEHGILTLRLRVQLNPTRFLAHQSDPNPGAISLKRPHEALRPDPDVEARLSARTLDGGDNVLTTPAQVPAFDKRDPWWAGILRTYTGHIRKLIVDLLTPTGSRAQLDRADFDAIRTAEVQFEFCHPDAVSWVANFRNALDVADDASGSRLYRGAEGQRNAVVAYLGLTKDARLKVYAKDVGRVRFEVVFKGPSRISQLVLRNGLSPSHGIADRLICLRDEAVKQLRKAWGKVMQVTQETAATGDMFDFMARLNSGVPAENRRTMLSLLGNHRRLTATPSAGIAPEPVCRALVREGILVPAGIVTRGPRRYALAPEWSEMFDRLLGRSDAVRSLH